MKKLLTLLVGLGILTGVQAADVKKETPKESPKADVKKDEKKPVAK
jgi:hypothetical protein